MFHTKHLFSWRDWQIGLRREEAWILATELGRRFQGWRKSSPRLWREEQMEIGIGTIGKAAEKVAFNCSRTPNTMNSDVCSLVLTPVFFLDHIYLKIVIWNRNLLSSSRLFFTSISFLWRRSQWGSYSAKSKYNPYLWTCDFVLLYCW